MKLTAFLTIPLLLANHAAFAGSIDGNGALALAALVAEHSPNVNPSDKISLVKFLNGQSNAPSSLNKKITVAAGKAPSEGSDWDVICKSFCPTIGVNVAGRVKKIVVEHLGVDADKVIDTANFMKDLGADSLDGVELVMAFEEEFCVEIPDDAADTIATVGDAIKFLEKASADYCDARQKGARTLRDSR